MFAWQVSLPHFTINVLQGLIFTFSIYIFETSISRPLSVCSLYFRQQHVSLRLAGCDRRKVIFQYYKCQAGHSTFLIASSCFCLCSLATWSCCILCSRSCTSACCLCRSSLRLSRASRWGDSSPNLRLWMHVWIAAMRGECDNSTTVESVATFY